MLREAAPQVPVTITPVDAEAAALDVGGTVYRPFPTGGFDIARRLRDMDAAGVDVHVLSATPQTYLYNQDAALTAITAAIQNDQIAKHIAAHPTRFLGIATLPMQDAKARRRRTQARHDQARPERRHDRLQRLRTRIWTIPASSRFGRRPRSSAPSCSSIRTMSPAPTG